MTDDARVESVVWLPIHTRSEANLREHWAVKAKGVQKQRASAKLLMLQALNDDVQFPAEITMTRIAPRTLESDNLARSLKHVRDGIADALGIDDGSPLLTWHYDQRKGGVRDYAIEVAIAWAKERDGQ